MMQTVRLGRTELKVTPICYGTWQFGGDWGAVEERAEIDGIRHARELVPVAGPAPDGM